LKLGLRYSAIATDYDETLACGGRVRAPAMEALMRVRDSGRALVLVTGRELPELRGVFSRIDLFTLVVAENGTLLYDPGTGEEEPLGPAAPVEFVNALEQRGVRPLSVGRCVVATARANEGAVLETIRDLGLTLQAVYNRDSIMVLPAGHDKGSGLRTALRRLGIGKENVVAIGDAENDLPLLEASGWGVAVANATTGLKEKAAQVTEGGCGAGVVEIIDQILAEDGGREAERIIERAVEP
jgi:hydroxymethylpyrimidine pyrophosphatase-like HAD family hydrolase